ncbi:MAG: GAF domain-containing sensor histidine kinase [Armatimonadetes bacterium]|nr:GAF domain-containing sensor histidine kinase [Armatimonadota bacterium]
MPSGCDDTVEGLKAEVALLERQLAAVARLAGELSSITKLDETIQEALRVSLELVDAHAGSIILHDEKKGKLVFRYVIGEAANDLMGMELETDQGIAGAVFHSGKTRVSEDVTKERDHDSGVGKKVHYLTQNMVTVPLKAHENRCIGVMQVLNKSDGRFNDHDVATLDILGAQVAAAIEATRLQEEARLAHVVQFIGDISHDVKNMITPVQTSAQTLLYIGEDVFSQFDEALEAGECPDELKQRLAATIQELRDLLPELVELMLDGADTVQQRMAEISAAVKGIVAQPHFEKADITDVVRRAVALLEHQAEKAGVALGVEVIGDVPQFAVDKKQIYNAVYNLVFNALDACDPGASITVKISAQPDGEFPEGGYCQVSCVDTGAGMPEHVRAKLFTVDAVSTKPMGTGLGTQIIKNVVDAHGGVISVESTEGVGTTITLRIPLDREETPGAAES